MNDKELLSEQGSKELLLTQKQLLSDEVARPKTRPKEEDEEIVVIERDNSTSSPRYKAIYKGEVVLDMIRSVGNFFGGYARVTFVGKKPSGLINTKGEFFSIDQYDWISHFRNKIAIASIDGKLGIVDSEWEILVPFECEKIGNAESGDTYSYDIYEDSSFDENNTIIPCFIKRKKCFFDVISRKLFRTGYNIVKKNGLCGIYDEEMSEVLPCKYKWAVRINDVEFLLREKDNLIYYNAVTGDYVS